MTSAYKSAYARIISSFNQTVDQYSPDKRSFIRPTSHGSLHRLESCAAHFPLPTPFPTQIQVMKEITKATTSHQHALIESPTGTGKTLALLCGVLAWQQAEYEAAEMRDNEDHQERCAPPLVFYATRTLQQARSVVKELRGTPYRVRMACLAARLHCCLFRDARSDRWGVDSNCESYRAAMELCESNGCPHLRAMESMPETMEALEHLLPNEYTTSVLDGVWDIEDCINVCTAHTVPVSSRLCPYYVSKELAKRADLIVLPYSYLLNPSQSILGQFTDRVSGSVVIFDEAHNIEDNCREEASWDASVTEILRWIAFVDRLGSAECGSGLDLFSSVGFEHEAAETLRAESKQLIFALGNLREYLRAAERRAAELRLSIREQPPAGTDIPIAHFGLDEKCPTVRFLRAIGLDESCLDTLQSFTSSLPAIVVGLRRLSAFLTANNAAKRNAFLSELEAIGRRVSELNVFLGLLYDHPAEYIASIVESWAPNRNPTLRFRLNCLRAGVAMEPISAAVRSVILASGTLAPFGSLLAELGPSMAKRCGPSVSLPHVVARHQFQIHLMASLPVSVQGLDEMSYPHFISLCRANEEVVTCQRIKLNADAFTQRFFWRLGLFLILLATNMEGGLLLFFGKYSAIDLAIAVWRTVSWNDPTETSTDAMTMWDALQERFGPICVDSRQSTAFSAAISEYRDAVATQRRALFLSVYRSKLSEGLSLNDALARVVVCLGVPYASLDELAIRGKRTYNDRARREADKRKPRRSPVGTPSLQNSPAESSEAVELCWGQTWYDQNAYKAIFQAAGRCLRHSRDYGVVFLVDDRHDISRMRKFAPRWTLPFISSARETPLTSILEDVHEFFFVTNAA